MCGLDRFPYDEGSRVVGNCEWCGGEIYAGDEVKRVDDGGGFVHASICADLYANERIYDTNGTIDENGNID